MKKHVLVALALILTLTTLFTSIGLAEKPSKVTFVMNGDMTERMRDFTQNELHEYLLEKYNIDFKIEYIPWGENAELRLAAGEDLACLGDNQAAYEAKGYIADLTDVMHEHGQDLLASVDWEDVESQMIDGKIVATVMGRKNNASEWYQFCVRQDLLEEVGMTEITSVEDLEKFYLACKELHPNYIGYAGGNATDLYAGARALAYTVSDKNMYFVSGGQTYLNTYVFTDANANDDVLYSWLESEEFEKVAKISQRWQEMGIMSSDWLTDPSAGEAKFNAGMGMWMDGNAGRPLEKFTTLRANDPDARLVNYRIGNTEGRERVRMGGFGCAFNVGVKAEDPAAYIKVVNDIYESQETFDFWVYGVEGVDYTLTENGQLANHTADGVVFPEWVTWNVDYNRYNEEIPQSMIDEYTNWNNDAIEYKFNGFVFDPKPVSDILPQLDAVAAEYFTPIIVGLRDYDTNYPEALKRLKAAGIDEYMAEYQRQVTEWWNQQAGTAE